MRSTFNILFYVNKSKEKNGVVPVMGRVTINGTQSQFSCKKTIPLDMWDVKGNCAKGRSKEALQINRELDNIKAQIIKHYQHLSDREAFVTAEMVRNSYQGFGSEYETLLSAFDKDIANQKKRVGKDRAASTLWAMERSRKDVADFIQSHYRRTDMSMLELTPEFIKDFAAYLSTDRGLANGTIWQRCMWLKGVVLRAHYNGKIPRNPFAQFHISPNCKEREFLTEEELKAVATHEFEDDNLAFVRDIFVFVCFTALSFIDVKNLTTDNIVDINGDKWIISKRHKTNIPFQVKLMDVPLQIIDRYKHLREDKLVFGKMNYWSMCKKLKTVMTACGIEKAISYHCGRHSFATLALSKGMPIESVSRVLGHTNIVTTQIYARITSQKLDNDLTMLGTDGIVRTNQPHSSLLRMGLNSFVILHLFTDVLQLKRCSQQGGAAAEGVVVGVGVDAVEDGVGVVALVQEVIEFEAEDEALEFVLGGGVEEGHALVLVGGELAAHMVVVQREVEGDDGEDVDGTAVGEGGQSLTPSPSPTGEGSSYTFR